ncbi:hypothetical protein PFLUV_G00116000 [Perca fluviatilis]|uniref:Uncharacterized protein n=1 Tax=Perca fluviatilis TaxID=8168 RepID=A0A6A5F5B9_PERFL|nr:hypothetical protein PFLUV_G00116000 [Perca fluviatilis]
MDKKICELTGPTYHVGVALHNNSYVILLSNTELSLFLNLNRFPHTVKGIASTTFQESVHPEEIRCLIL